MGVGAGLYMCDLAKKFTFAISSPDEFLSQFHKSTTYLLLIVNHSIVQFQSCVATCRLLVQQVRRRQAITITRKPCGQWSSSLMGHGSQDVTHDPSVNWHKMWPIVSSGSRTNMGQVMSVASWPTCRA